MKRIAIVYGYVQLANGDLDAQSIGRCKKALDLYQRGKVDEIYITVGARRNGRLMGGKMKAWLMTYGGLTTSEVILDARGLNTAGETELCSVILGLRADRCKVVAVSSWYHLLRIWLLWLWRGRMVRLAGSTEGVHLKDVLIEPVKLVNSTLRPFRSAKFVPQTQPLEV